MAEDAPSWLDILNAAASVATAAGVFIAVWQIKIQLRQDATEFEDDLDQEVREIMLALPMPALFGEELSPEGAEQSLDQFYRYIDLCNQQIFLRQQGRISKDRWETWRDEMRLNLSKPAFKAAWEHIKRRAPGEFALLRRLESAAFNTDPDDW